MDCFDRPVKTSCCFVNMARKAEIAWWKLFFQSKLQVFPDSKRIWTAQSAGECCPYREGLCCNPNWSLWVQKFSQIFFLSIILATYMLESHSRALKTWIFA